MESIKRIFDYYKGIHQELFWNNVNNSKIINKCPINGKFINYNNSSNKDADVICLIHDEVPEASANIIIPSPCISCGYLQLAETRIRSGCNLSGTLNYCFDRDEPLESCPGNCEYEVIGICKRFCEIEPQKITLMKWM